MDLRGQHEDATEVNEWMEAMKILIGSTLTYPIQYARVLIQIGYEPIAPRPGKSLFGSPILVLANIFQYVKHIIRVDGLVGCYRGFAPKFIGKIVSYIGSEKIALKLGFERIPDVNENVLSEEESEKILMRRLKRDLVLSVSAVTLSYPFNVISVRMMAQFVGKEITYETILSSVKEIWNTEGIFGFFSGYIPKLLYEVSFLVIAHSATYVINKYFVRDGLANLALHIVSHDFVVAWNMYPYQVVSTCMKVTGSSLIAGQPPQMPIYRNWAHCWSELHAAGQQTRGRCWFFRYDRVQPKAL